MMQVIIREATENDYEVIGQLIINELGYSEIDFAQLYNRLKRMSVDRNSTYTMFVAVSEETVIGFVGICRLIAFEAEGDYFRIIALAVSEKYQNQGVGTALLKHIETFALWNNISGIGLNSGLQRDSAHKFYECNGYRKKSFGFSKTLK